MGGINGRNEASKRQGEETAEGREAEKTGLLSRNIYGRQTILGEWERSGIEKENFRERLEYEEE